MLPCTEQIGKLEVDQLHVVVFDDFTDVGWVFVFGHWMRSWWLGLVECRGQEILATGIGRQLCHRGEERADTGNLEIIRRHSTRDCAGFRVVNHHTAFSPISSVRMRTACSTGSTKTFPSPILPVLAALTTTLTALSTISSASTTSTLTLGRKSTVYSLPR